MAETTTETTGTRIPPWLEAAMQDITGRAGDISQEEYPIYPGPRVAGFDPLQLQAFADTQGIAGLGAADMQRARGALDQASTQVGTSNAYLGQGAGALSSAQGMIDRGIGPLQEAAGLIRQGQGPLGSAQQMIGRGDVAMGAGLDTLGTAKEMTGLLGDEREQFNNQLESLRDQIGGIDTEFGQDDADFYMNPFTQNVIDEALKEINRSKIMQENELSDRQIKSGAFGGSRGEVGRQEIGRNALDIKNQAASKLMLENFMQSQMQFERDRQAELQGYGQQLNTFNTGLNSMDLGQRAAQLMAGIGEGQGNIGAQYGQLGGQYTNAANAYGNLGGQMGDVGRGYGTLGSGLASVGGAYGALGNAAASGANALTAGAGQYGNLASQSQLLGLNSINAMSNAGAQQQALQQAGLDLAFQDFQTQQDYPKQQLQFYSNITDQMGSNAIQGAPQSVSTTKPNPSLPGQILGGIGGIGGLLG